jgi:hypothetical protein
MRVEYFGETKLSESADALVRFDMDSIRQVVAAGHGRMPDVFLVDADSYERNGRVLRDSPTSRLLAYSASDRVIYANDGCNSCTRRLNAALETFTDSELQTFAEDNGLRLDLLERLAEISV